MLNVESPRLDPPGPKSYRPSILKVLGKLTKHSTSTFVRAQDVYDLVLRDMGYDPDNLAQYGDPARGWRKGGAIVPAAIDRRIMLSFQSMTGAWKTKSPPLVVYGAKKSLWGLTEAGLKQIPRNRTAMFLKERLTAPGGIRNSDLYRTMKTTLQRKLKVSSASSQIDDHIQQCFQRLIHRDAFGDWLEAGNEISNSSLAGFALRSAFTDCRDSARNPVCRRLYGAKTEQELGQEVTETDITVQGFHKDNKIARIKSGDDYLLYEIVDTMHPSVDESVAFAAMWQEILNHFKSKRPESWERLAQVIALRVAGNSIEEIGTEMDVSGNRAAALLAEARAELRHANSLHRFKSFNVS